MVEDSRALAITSSLPCRGSRYIAIVEDEEILRGALAREFARAGYSVGAFASAEDLLDEYRPGSACCLLLDICLPGIDGLELFERLRKADDTVPVVFLSGRASVDMTLRVVKAHADAFLAKPLSAAEVIGAVSRVLQRRNAANDVAQRLARLTPRELDVMALVVEGYSNKMTAGTLNITEATVKRHRGRVMKKLRVDSVPALIRVALELGLLDVEPAAQRGLPGASAVRAFRLPRT